MMEIIFHFLSRPQQEGKIAMRKQSEKSSLKSNQTRKSWNICFYALSQYFPLASFACVLLIWDCVQLLTSSLFAWCEGNDTSNRRSFITRRRRRQRENIFYWFPFNEFFYDEKRKVYWFWCWWKKIFIYDDGVESIIAFMKAEGSISWILKWCIIRACVIWDKMPRTCKKIHSMAVWGIYLCYQQNIFHQPNFRRALNRLE